MEKQNYLKEGRDLKTQKAEYVFNKISAYGTDISDYWGYGKDIVKHKVDVYKAGRELSVPRTRLLLHDVDKFFPKMFMRYAEWFYGPEGAKGTKNPKLKKEWRTMVNNHYARSDHHHKEKDKVTALESLADWYSAQKRATGYKPGFPTFRTWLDKNIDRFNVNPEAKAIVKTTLDS